MNALSNITIFSLPLTKVTEACNALDEKFFTQLISEVPTIGKEAPTYYLINNSLTLNNPHNLVHINAYNNFVMQSQTQGQLLQLVKNNNGEQQNQTSEKS